MTCYILPYLGIMQCHVMCDQVTTCKQKKHKLHM